LVDRLRLLKQSKQHTYFARLDLVKQNEYEASSAGPLKSMLDWAFDSTVPSESLLGYALDSTVFLFAFEIIVLLRVYFA